MKDTCQKGPIIEKRGRTTYLFVLSLTKVKFVYNLKMGSRYHSKRGSVEGVNHQGRDPLDG